jgi:hypothetical protein
VLLGTTSSNQRVVAAGSLQSAIAEVTRRQKSRSPLAAAGRTSSSPGARISAHLNVSHGPHRSGRCALRLKIPAHSTLYLRPYLESQRLRPIPTRSRSPPAQQKIPHLLGFYIGAPGFEPGTSPTRITCKHRVAIRKALQIDRSRLLVTSSRIRGFSGGLRWIRHTTRLCARSGRRARQVLARQRRGVPVHCRPSSRQRSEHAGDYARRRPVPPGQPLERLSTTPPRVRARPVIGRRQPPVAVPPIAHRRENALATPAPLGRAGMAGLAVRVGAALAVARLGVSAAAAAHPDVTRLDRPRLLPSGVVGRLARPLPEP